VPFYINRMRREDALGVRSAGKSTKVKKEQTWRN
jgi:hypothetical protein